MKQIHSSRMVVLWLVLLHTALFPFWSEASISYTAKFDMSKLRTTVEEHEGEKYCKITYDSLYNSGEVGNPSLPTLYLTFAVPKKACNFKVEATPEYAPSLQVPHKVLPVQKPMRTDGTDFFTFTKPNSVTYATDGYISAVSATLCSEGYIAGDNHVVTIAVEPLNYNPKRDKVVLSQSISINISYDENGTAGKTNAIVPISRGNNELKMQERAMAKSMVVNPQDADRFWRTVEQVQVSPVYGINVGNINIGNIDTTTVNLNDSSFHKHADANIDLSPRSYNYTVITSKRFAPAFKRLIALKRQKGYSAGVTLVEDIMKDAWCSRGDTKSASDKASALKDSAGCVRAYLQKAWKDKHNPLQYLLMGGRSMVDAPFRYGYSGLWGENPSELDKVIPTDLYYSNVTTNWNADGDKYLGKFSKKFDYSPHIAVGRLLCESKEDIYNYTDKLLCYELNPGNGKREYLSRMLAFESAEMKRKKEGESVINSIQPFFSECILVRDKETFERSTMGEDIINIWNDKQLGFVSMHGHGSPKTIDVGYKNKYVREESNTSYTLCLSEEFRITQGKQSPYHKGIDCLKNKDYPSVCYSISCHTMPYDDKFWQWNGASAYYGRNFGQAMIFGKDYGGVAFLGNTRQGYIGTSCHMENVFINFLKKTNFKLGKAECWSKMYDINIKGIYEHHVNLAHNLLGDPEVEMWTGIPLDYNGITVTRKDKSITVSGIHSQDSATVAYCSNNNVQGMKTTANGSVTFTNVSPNSSIMVYQHNYIPYIAPLLLQNDTIKHSQYVLASTVSAGKSVDSNRTAGPLVFAKGIRYEIEATGDVNLNDGVVVDKDACVIISTPGHIHVKGLKIESGGRVVLASQGCVIGGWGEFSASSNIEIKKYNPDAINREY